MIDVWIMTPQAARRDRLYRSVSKDREIHIAGTAATFPLLRSMMSEVPADLVVIDLPAEVSTIARDWLFELLDRLPVVLLSLEPNPEIFNRVLQAGVGGLLRTDASSDQIIHAIKSVASGLMILDGALIPQRPDDEVLSEPLTPRESEVLRLLADGLGNKQIAAQLDISEHTIKFHIRSILGKLGVSSRTEAVSRGLRSGLIEL
jgi:two-component system, NarL family, response regulator YdfI